MTAATDKVPDISFEAFHQRQIPQNKMLGSNFALAKPIATLLATTRASARLDAATSAKIAPPADPVAAPDTTAYVVVAPTDVYELVGGKGAKINQLSAGTQLTLIETSGAWSVVAKGGTRLGFVKQDSLLKLH